MTDKDALIAKVGAAAVALAIPVIIAWEGDRRVPYRDPYGSLTVCVGHTGADIKPGKRYTGAECRAMLDADLLAHAKALDCIKTPLNEGQRAAFLSLAFNIGARRFCASTLARKANAGDMAGACAQLSAWTGGYDRTTGVYARLPGLVNRRAVERKLCETGSLA